MSTQRLVVLEKSLAKKEQHFEDKLQNHFDDVRSANGQPLNDKRNGQATLNRWEKQNQSLRAAQVGIQITKDAIEREQDKIIGTEHVKSLLPAEITSLIDAGVLTQWRKYPNIFFVAGVDKARIVWDMKKRILTHSYVSAISDKEAYAKFRDTFNTLKKALD